jgi:hypothetical protein
MGWSMKMDSHTVPGSHHCIGLNNPKVDFEQEPCMHHDSRDGVCVDAFLYDELKVLIRIGQEQIMK